MSIYNEIDSLDSSWNERRLDKNYYNEYLIGITEFKKELIFQLKEKLENKNLGFYELDSLNSAIELIENLKIKNI